MLAAAGGGPGGAGGGVRGRVVVTTQSQHWPVGQALDVPVLDLEVAAAFLVSRTGNTADRGAAQELAGELGGLPLALEQAATPAP